VDAFFIFSKIFFFIKQNNNNELNYVHSVFYIVDGEKQRFMGQFRSILMYKTDDGKRKKKKYQKKQKKMV